MTDVQQFALERLCKAYRVLFDPSTFTTRFDLPPGYVAGWIGDHIYVGVSPEGDVSS